MNATIKSIVKCSVVRMILIGSFAAAAILSSQSTLAQTTEPEQPATTTTTTVTQSPGAEPPTVVIVQEYTGHPSQASAGGSEPRVIPERAGLLKLGPVTLVEPIAKDIEKWASEEFRLDLGFRASFAFQQATNGPGERSAAGQDYRIYGTWHAINWEEGKEGSAGNVYFRLEYRDDLFTDITPAQLNTQIGTLFGTTYGFDKHALAIVQLYWEQFLADGDIRLRMGKLDPDDYYNLGRWADDYRYFLNTLFSAFPGANHPSGGLGCNGQWYITPEWTLTGGFSDVQGKKTRSGFETFFDDFDLFVAVDITWSPTIEGLGKGNYRLGVEHRDASERKGTPEDNGFYFNVDQEICKDVAPFFRFWHGEGNATGIKTAIAGGIGIENCFNSPGDAFGVGFGCDFPEDDSLARSVEYATEIFYRFQLTRAIQWTIGAQVVFDPVLDDTEDVVGIFETRLLIEF
jgi:porin